jgi:hypothetical protein
MIPNTKERVAVNTDEQINQRIREQTEQRVLHCAAEGPAAIDRRLAALDKEWDIERYLETMAPTFSLLGLALGLTKNRKWLALPVVVQAFFLQHAIQGWCPPVPVLRRLGVRTIDEINEERYALKALRGDFKQVASQPAFSLDEQATEALEAART